MTRFTYVITEGVSDSIFLAQVFRQRYSLPIASRMSELGTEAKEWLQGFRWPVDDNISRMAVHAPVFLQDQARLVVLRNARGINGVQSKLRADFELFSRRNWGPTGLAIVIDSDDAPATTRFQGFAEMLTERGYPLPAELGVVATRDALRSGVFALPRPNSAGTLEDLLLPISASRFPQLHAAAEAYVDGWADDSSTDFVELRKPGGRKKAKLSAISAMVLPGKPVNALIEDKLVRQDTLGHEALVELLQFLDSFLLE